MGRSLRNFVYLLAAVGGLTFFAGLVFAQAPGALPIPVHISTGAPTPTGLQSVVTFDARGAPAAANNAGYYSRPVLVSNNTLGQLGKGLMRRAVPVAAMIAAVEAAGWAIDELSGQVTSGGTGQQFIPPGDRYWVVVGLAGYFPSMQGVPYKACMSMFGNGAATHCPTAHLAELIQSNAGWDEYYIRVTSAPHATFVARYAHPYTQPLPNANYVPASPVADAQIGQLVANNPALAAQALHNADGSVNRNPDVLAAAQALAAQLAATDPTQQPDPVGEWNTGQQGGPATGQAAELEFPAFCGWATAVCDAIDWMRDDSDPVGDQDMPEVVPDLSATQWSSGLGGGSCPPDVVVANVMGGEVVFPLSGFCAAAEIIRPIVLAGAALLALFIVGGYRRG